MAVLHLVSTLIYRLSMGWTDRESNRGQAKISLPVQTGPGTLPSPSLLYDGYRGPFPEVKRLGRGVTTHRCLAPRFWVSWPVLWWNLLWNVFWIKIFCTMVKSRPTNLVAHNFAWLKSVGSLIDGVEKLQQFLQEEWELFVKNWNCWDRLAVPIETGCCLSGRAKTIL